MVTIISSYLQRVTTLQKRHQRHGLHLSENLQGLVSIVGGIYHRWLVDLDPLGYSMRLLSLGTFW